MEKQHVELPPSLPNEHTKDLSEEDYVEVTIRISTKHQCRVHVPRSWTGKDLKMYLSLHHPARPNSENMKLIYSGKVIADDESMDILRSNWKQVPVSIYLMDKEIDLSLLDKQLPKGDTQEENPNKDKKSAKDPEKRKKQREKQEEKRRQKAYKKLAIPKSVFFSQSIFFFIFFLYMVMNSTSFNFIFWVIAIAIPFYYYEVKRNINEFYNKKKREMNIPYESEKQLELRNRENTVNQRIDNIMNSNRFDSDEYEYKYTFIETISSLIYYFFMSLFPGYIERQLDIFQKEYNLLQSKKKIRDRKLELERLKKEKNEKEAQESQEQATFKPQSQSKGDSPIDDLPEDVKIESE